MDDDQGWRGNYTIVRACDVEREGMWLEAYARKHELVLTAYYSDADASMAFEQFRADLPAEFVAWFRDEAARLLPPVADPGSLG